MKSPEPPSRSSAHADLRNDDQHAPENKKRFKSTMVIKFFSQIFTSAKYSKSKTLTYCTYFADVNFTSKKVYFIA